MLLVVSTLINKDGGDGFLRILRYCYPDEPILSWSMDRPTDPSIYFKQLRWSFRHYLASRPVRPSTLMKKLDLQKYAARLPLMDRQDLDVDQALVACGCFAREVEKLLKILNPRLVFCVNPLLPHTGIVYDLVRLKGRSGYAFERGFLAGSYIVDPVGYGGFSPFSWKNFSDLTGSGRQADLGIAGRGAIGRILREQNRRQASRSAEATRTIQLPKGFFPKVLVLGMADVNTGLYPSDHPDRLKNSPGYSSSREFALSVAGANRGTTLYRPHPNMWHSDLKEDTSGRLITVSNDIADLIEWADIVAANGSSLEFTVLARGKPLVLGGFSMLTGKDIAYEALVPSEIQQALDKAAALEEFPRRLERFAAITGYYSTRLLIEPDNLKQAQSIIEREVSCDIKRPARITEYARMAFYKISRILERPSSKTATPYHAFLTV